MTGVLVLPLAVPLLVAAVLLVVRQRAAQRALGLATTGTVLGLGAWLVARTGDGQVLVTQVAGWPAGISIPFAADRLSALLVTVSALLVLVCGWFAAVTAADRRPMFWPLVLMLSGGVYGAYLTADLFNLFVCVEIMLLPSYVLLTLEGTREQLSAAPVYVTLNLLASTVLIIGVGLVYGAAGTVNLAELAGAAATPGVAIGAAVVVAAMTVKSALVPVHGWLPRTYPHASPAVVALFSGLLTKVGVYALLRIYTVVFDSDARYAPLIVGVAVASMVLGVLGAVGQGAVRSILTFHMVSQTGYIALGIALTTALGRTATVLYLIQYVIVKTALFLTAGALHWGYGTDRLDRLGGLAERDRLLALTFIAAAFALIGLPPFSGFAAKLLLTVAAVREQQYLGAAAVVAVSLLTMTSMLKIWNGVFWGAPADLPGQPPGAATSAARRVPASVVAPAAVLTAGSLALGLGAQGLLLLAEGAGAALTDPGRYVQAVLG